MDEGSLSLPPFTGHDEKSQRNYHLALRGNSLNPMIDAATPLLGMVTGHCAATGLCARTAPCWSPAGGYPGLMKLSNCSAQKR